MKKKTPRSSTGGSLTCGPNSTLTCVGVQFDGLTIALLDKTAQALLNITELFKAQNIKFDTVLRIGNPREITTEETL